MLILGVLQVLVQPKGPSERSFVGLVHLESAHDFELLAVIGLREHADPTVVDELHLLQIRQFIFVNVSVLHSLNRKLGLLVEIARSRWGILEISTSLLQRLPRFCNRQVRLALIFHSKRRLALIPPLNMVRRMVDEAINIV